LHGFDITVGIITQSSCNAVSLDNECIYMHVLKQIVL